MMTSRNGWVLIVVPFLLVTPARAQVHEVLDLFEASLSTSVRVKREFNVSEAIYEMELCPTNLCDVFELRGASSGADIDILLDFALIYMLYALPYPQLGGEVTVDSVTGERLLPPRDLVINELDRGPGLLDKYGGNCAVGSEAERALCVMRDLVVKYDMRFYSSRYDGGATYIQPSRTIVDRLNVLSPQRIESFLRLARSYRQ